MDKVEQVARLIRSKGVGVYFVTQNPADVPEDILGQLGNRVQHALRAYTAKDRKALRLAAETYRENPRFSVEEAILQVGVGEAVTSFLEKKGVPGVVERTLIRPPSSHLGAIEPAERHKVIEGSPLHGKYETPIDRRSAYEVLQARAIAAVEDAEKVEKYLEDERPEVRDFNAARRYSGLRVGRANARQSARQDSFGQALSQAFVKELKGATGRSIYVWRSGKLFQRALRTLPPFEPRQHCRKIFALAVFDFDELCIKVLGHFSHWRVSIDHFCGLLAEA